MRNKEMEKQNVRLNNPDDTFRLGCGVVPQGRGGSWFEKNTYCCHHPKASPR